MRATYTRTFCPLNTLPKYGISFNTGMCRLPKLLIRGCIKAPRVLNMPSKSNVVTPQALKLRAIPTTMTSDLKCNTNRPNMRETTRELKMRSEEHTSELQSRGQLVCRLLL